uniref:Putative tail tape measure protein n=1 Tax=viral metagenome TaxID=1070528 RepID=A0A6H1ZU09_9ZZZZ
MELKDLESLYKELNSRTEKLEKETEKERKGISTNIKKISKTINTSYGRIKAASEYSKKDTDMLEWMVRKQIEKIKEKQESKTINKIAEYAAGKNIEAEMKPMEPSRLTDIGKGETPKQLEESGTKFREVMVDTGARFNRELYEGARGFEYAMANAESLFRTKWLSTINEGIDIVGQIGNILGGLGIITGTGFGGIVAALFGGHSGGTFEGGRKIASFAGGGNFIVPSGYPRDSFPMLVESGERVKVTPSNRAGDEAKILIDINKSIKILSMNMAENRGNININANLDSLKFVENTVNTDQKRLKAESSFDN